MNPPSDQKTRTAVGPGSATEPQTVTTATGHGPTNSATGHDPANSATGHGPTNSATGAGPAAPSTASTATTATPPFLPDEDLLWYKDAVIYELHIKAFCDGNGDGIGDFHGLLQKLDYLQDLGVTAIWLLPFYPSPLKDDGYDIADYYSINPAYGDINIFSHFLKEAHRRNLKVITELVINHTSDQHPWFQRARRAPKGSKERNYYVWTDDPTQYKDVRIIFQDFETSNWTWDPLAEQYFWHRFFHHQPDLNYDNPHVQEEVLRIIDFWCGLGVDGFRLDAVPYLYEREGTNGENLPETHVYLKKLRAHVDQHFPGTVFLAEANMWPEDSASYFGEGDECHMNYHFPVMPRMFMALQMEDRYPITDIFEQTPEIPPTCQWAIFLRNHDELTLEMVTDEERDYMYQAYARDPKAKINMGIRHRLAPLLENNRRKMELLNSLLLALPGTPVIYYGDEIGMGDNFYLGDRDGVRTPMQWSPDRNAGFSAANPQKLYLPLILDPEYHYEAVNVETQRANTSSLFWYMKRLISVRKKFRTFGRGNLKFLSVENPKVLAFTRTYGEETLLIVVNLSKFSQAAEVDLLPFKGYVPVDIFSSNRFPLIKEDGLYFFTLAPYAFQWFTLEKAHPDMDEKGSLPLLIIRGWDTLMEGTSRRALENNILPRYLPKTNWYTESRRAIYSVSISDYARLGDPVRPADPVKAASAKQGRVSKPADAVRPANTVRPAGDLQAAPAKPAGNPKTSAPAGPPAATSAIFWLLIEVTYQSGLPGLYQLPLIFLSGDRAEKFLSSCPQAVIAQVRAADTEGLLIDAFFTVEGQTELFQKMAGHKKVHLAPDSIHHDRRRIEFYGNQPLKEHLLQTADIKPRIHISDEYNTSITYDGAFFLKMYRRIDLGINPDLEITRFLSKEVKFPHIPTFIGAIEWKYDKDTIVLGIMQEMIENHGDGYTFFSERAHNYMERVIAGSQKNITSIAPVPPIPAAQPNSATQSALPTERLGTLIDPVRFDELPEPLQLFIGASAGEQARLLGIRTAEMHLALASGTGKDFKPEAFSLHYQRSLFSSMQSLVRQTYQSLSAKMSSLPPDLQERKERILAYRPELLNILKKIYAKKLDAIKIRIHGSYHLRQVLLTGKDLVIQDYGGNPSHPTSERRLKRSPLTDLASMVASIHEVTFDAFLNNQQSLSIDLGELLPYAPYWAFYISGFFIRAWFDTVKGSALVPAAKEDCERMWQNYLLQKALFDFNRDLNRNPARIVSSQAIIRSVLAVQS
ncbi:MAG TPA: maltose alpha-D-glucosyltransferase [Puia sp.]|nr:maltose alpha-D-glucosyltransferase [Puia sp.]